MIQTKDKTKIMKDQEIMEVYRSFLPFLVRLCGTPCGILLYDIHRPESSAVYEFPGPDGRTVPAPTVDYAASLIAGNGPSVPYRTDEDFPPDTWPVRNDSRLIGLLCIHRDLSVLSDLSNVLSRLKSLYSLPDDEGVKDRASTLSGWMEDRIQETIDESGIRPERMNRAQKLEILRKLQAQGIMDMKGCVPQIAAMLDISVPTVYRYLKRL